MEQYAMGKIWKRSLRAGVYLFAGCLLALQADAQTILQPMVKGSSPLKGLVTPVSASRASVRPLATYTPWGPLGILQVPYWSKHLPDDAGNFSFDINFSQPVGANGGFLWYSLRGSAQDGLNYTIAGTNPVQLMPGATSVSVPVDILNPGQYYREVSLEIELTQGVGVSIDPNQRFGKLSIRSTTPPPTISVPPGSLSVTPGGQVLFQVQLSQPSLEPVALHYTVDSASSLSQYAFPPSGTTLIPAGTTVANLRLICGPQAVPGQELILNLRHERDGVKYVVPALDPNLTTNTDLYPQTIHTDENLWSYSVGGVQEFENSDIFNPPLIGPSYPGVPTDNITGGSFYAPGHESQNLIDLVDQLDPNPILDPFSQTPLKVYAISTAATGVVPYLRKSFGGAFCGANTQLYKLPEYMRVSYYIALPQGLDAPLAIPFFRVGIRVRTQNMNHGVAFRIGSTGQDFAGNAVPVTPTSLGPIGLWNRFSVDSRTNKYGIEEDEYGVRVWFSHKLDPTVTFTDEHGGLHRETPGFDSGNPIEYPAWLSSGDASMQLSGVPSNMVEDALGRGNLIYGLMWEVSDSSSIFGGNLNPYFPKPGAWWEPQGNAVISQPTTLHFVVQ